MWQKNRSASDIAKAAARLYQRKSQLSISSDKAEDKRLRAGKDAEEGGETQWQKA
jgi:hypothetical protein